MCRDLQSSVARPAIIGAHETTIIATINPPQTTINATETAIINPTANATLRERPTIIATLEYDPRV